MTATTRVGYVADFCPVCVALRVCALERLQMDDVVEEQRVCVACNVAVLADASAYASIADEPGTVDDLVESTHPDIGRVQSARLALEAQVKADPAAIDSDTRRQLLLEPLRILAAHITPYMPSPDPVFLQRTVLPRLRHAISRLQPSRLEMESVLQELKAEHSPIASVFTSSELLALAPQVGGLTPEKAATVFRIGAVLGTLLIGAFLVNEAYTDSVRRTLEDDFAMAIFLVACTLTLLCMVLPRALERREGWARWVGILMAALIVWMFPIGTIAGAFIGWSLVAGWKTPASREPRWRM